MEKKNCVKFLQKETTNINFRTELVSNPHGPDITRYWIPREDFIKLFFKSGCNESAAFIKFVCNLLRENGRMMEEYKQRIEAVTAGAQPAATQYLQESAEQRAQLVTILNRVTDIISTKDQQWVSSVEVGNEKAVQVAQLSTELSFTKTALAANESKVSKLEDENKALYRENESKNSKLEEENKALFKEVIELRGEKRRREELQDSYNTLYKEHESVKKRLSTVRDIEDLFDKTKLTVVVRNVTGKWPGDELGSLSQALQYSYKTMYEQLPYKINKGGYMVNAYLPEQMPWVEDCIKKFYAKSTRN